MSGAIRVEVPGFEKRRLEVKPAALFAPRLLLDGERQRAVQGGFRVRNDSGVLCKIRFRRPFALDPIPIVDIDGKRLEIARPLTGGEKAWLVVPFMLVFIGGAVGGGIAAAAIFLNSRILRAKRSAFRRHLLCLAVMVSALVLFFALAVMLSAFLPQRS